MMRSLALALVLASVSLPAGAQQRQPAESPAPPLAQTATNCTEPRPQMCTQIYRPVCGTRRDGTRQTYGNACGACADANVVSHIPGPC